eukprot:scpid68144/ scgid34865/ 
MINRGILACIVAMPVCSGQMPPEITDARRPCTLEQCHVHHVTGPWLRLPEYALSQVEGHLYVAVQLSICMRQRGSKDQLMHACGHFRAMSASMLTPARSSAELLPDAMPNARV